MFNEYPYTNMTDLNLDWIIKTVKDLRERWAAVEVEWTDQQSEFTALKNFIDNYFDNLDVSAEVSDKLDSMRRSGELLQLVAGTVNSTTRSAVNAWLDENILQPTDPVIDKSLTIANAAADAETVGDVFIDTDRALYSMYANSEILRHIPLRKGRNLILYSDGHVAAPNSGDWRVSDYFHLNNDDLYYALFDNDTGIRLGCYDEHSNFLGLASTSSAALPESTYKVIISVPASIAAKYGYEYIPALFFDESYTLTKNFRGKTFYDYLNTIPDMYYDISRRCLGMCTPSPVPTNTYYPFEGTDSGVNGIHVSGFTGGDIAQLDLAAVAGGVTYVYMEYHTNNGKQITKRSGYTIAGNRIAGSMWRNGVQIDLLGKFDCVYFDGKRALYKGKDLQLTNERLHLNHYFSYLAYEDGTPINTASDGLAFDKCIMFNSAQREDFVLQVCKSGNMCAGAADMANHVSYDCIREIMQQIPTPSPLSGYKLAACGDSIMYGDGIDTEYPDDATRPTFAQIVAARNGMEYVNLGKNGGTVAVRSGRTDSMVERLNSIPTDSDYIVMLFGWNDQSSVDVGDTSSTSTADWCGAWNYVLNWLYVNRPTAKVMIMLPYLYDTIKASEMRQKLTLICKKYGVAYVDAQDCSVFPSTGYSTGISADMQTKLKSRYTVDGLHDNVASYQRRANAFEDMLKRL